MTIKGIKSVLPDPTVINPEDYKDKVITVDTSIYLYKYVYGFRESFLKGFKSLIKTWSLSTVIFVLDGASPELKRDLIKSRKELRESRDSEDRSKIVITSETIQELKDYIDSLKNPKVSWVQAEGEAEKHCAKMDCDAILTNDFDTFLFGGTHIIRNIKSQEYHLYDISVILEHLGITFDQFTEVCVACGCDYNLKGIPGFGPKKALKYIKTHVTFGDLIDDAFRAALVEFKRD
jgi:5'-3' exonuclease